MKIGKEINTYILVRSIHKTIGMRFLNFSYAIKNVDTSYYRWMMERIGIYENYLDASNNGNFRLLEDYLDYKKYASQVEDTHPSLKKLWKVGNIVNYYEGTQTDPCPVIYLTVSRFKGSVVNVFIENYEFHMWLIDLCKDDEEAVELITKKKKKYEVPEVKSPYDKIEVQEWFDSCSRSLFNGEFPDAYVRDECDLTEERIKDVEHLLKNKIVYKERTGGVEEEDWDDNTVSQMYVYVIAFFRKFPALMAMNKGLKHIVPQMLAETHGTVVSVMRKRQISWYVPYDLATRRLSMPPRELGMVIGHIPFYLSIKQNKKTQEKFYYLMKMDFHHLALKDQFYEGDKCLCQSPVRRNELN